MAIVDEIILNGLATAQQQTTLANTAARAAITASQGGISTSIQQVAYTFTAEEPDVPDVENANLTYDAKLAELIALLSDKLGEFFLQYYPLASDAFDAATNKLVDIITNGGTGLNPSVESQIWTRGRDRVVVEGMRTESQAFTEFTARGFSLPPGALAGRLMEARNEQMLKTQELARDAAIHQAEVTIETLKFAIAQAIDSRMKALNAAADYIRGIMSAPDAAARVASINSGAKAQMLAATADLYRARLTRDELALRIPTLNADNSVKRSGIVIDGFHRGVANRVSAAGAAAGVYGDTAAAALSSLASVASLSSIGFTETV